MWTTGQLTNAITACEYLHAKCKKKKKKERKKEKEKKKRERERERCIRVLCWEDQLILSQNKKDCSVKTVKES